MKTSSDKFETFVDVLVAGSGAGAFVAALTAKAAGLDVLMVEKSELYGGSTSYSGGGAWIPNHPVLVRHGEIDDPEKVFQYLVNIAGETVAHERLRCYVEEAPRMAEFIMNQSRWLADGFVWYRGYPDYYPNKGGNPAGRGIWPRPVNIRKLGDDFKNQRVRSLTRGSDLPKGAWMSSLDLRDLIRMRWGVDRLIVAKAMARLVARIVRYHLLGERMLGAGAALVARLRKAQLEKGIPMWLNSPITKLITDKYGAVIGAEVVRDGSVVRIGTLGGVVMATGGFDHGAMRTKYQPDVVVGWSSGSDSNTGDGQQIGEEVGAALDLMGEAWWIPGFPLPPGGITMVANVLLERQYPGQYIVNAAGKRFISEAAPYTDFGRAQIAGHHTAVSHIPAFMIFDERYRQRNFIMGRLPGKPIAPALFEHEIAFMADSIEELAEMIGVPPAALTETHDRFNSFARHGVDEDFHRGESAYENYYGDPTYRNPNLAPIEEPPFYALKMVPGDLGTKGGLLTNENAQVLRTDGRGVAGLYACGNVAASVMGTSYAGPGATIGPAMTFGYVAVRHIATQLGKRTPLQLSNTNLEPVSRDHS